MWITLNKLLSAPLQHPCQRLDIHQGERVCGRLLPTVPLVSEKSSSLQTSPLNVQRIGGVTMAENPVSTRPTLARKPHRYKVDEGLDVRFLCHANSTHVLQTLWRGLLPMLQVPYPSLTFRLLLARLHIDAKHIDANKETT